MFHCVVDNERIEISEAYVELSRTAIGHSQLLFLTFFTRKFIVNSVIQISVNDQIIEELPFKYATFNHELSVSYVIFDGVKFLLFHE